MSRGKHDHSENASVESIERPGQDVERALDYIRQTDTRVPEVALVLGSGLGDLALAARDVTIFEAADIPGYPIPSVRGHVGQVVIGKIDDAPVVFFRGRFHCYEGHGFESVTFPVRLGAALGARCLVVTNAAGSLHADMEAGSAMLIEDHLNFGVPDVFRRVRALLPPDRVRHHVNSRIPYDRDWIARVEAEALQSGIPLRKGTYLWTLGPSYETQSEIRFFRRAGADAVGMSTVPEVITAHLHGMNVAGISSITNLAAGLHAGPLMHEDVLEIAAVIRDKMIALVGIAVRNRPMLGT